MWRHAYIIYIYKLYKLNSLLTSATADCSVIRCAAPINGTCDNILKGDPGRGICCDYCGTYVCTPMYMHVCVSRDYIL